jgi:hypothetical protein
LKSRVRKFKNATFFITLSTKLKDEKNIQISKLKQIAAPKTKFEFISSSKSLPVNTIGSQVYNLPSLLFCHFRYRFPILNSFFDIFAEFPAILKRERYCFGF